MALIKVLAVSLGAIGLILASNLGPANRPAATAGTPQARTEFGGISAQTATAAGTTDAGAAWFTLGPEGLRRQLATR